MKTAILLLSLFLASPLANADRADTLIRQMIQFGDTPRGFSAVQKLEALGQAGIPSLRDAYGKLYTQTGFSDPESALWYRAHVNALMEHYYKRFPWQLQRAFASANSCAAINNIALTWQDIQYTNPFGEILETVAGPRSFNLIVGSFAQQAPLDFDPIDSRTTMLRTIRKLLPHGDREDLFRLENALETYSRSQSVQGNAEQMKEIGMIQRKIKRLYSKAHFETAGKCPPFQAPITTQVRSGLEPVTEAAR